MTKVTSFSQFNLGKIQGPAGRARIHTYNLGYVTIGCAGATSFLTYGEFLYMLSECNISTANASATNISNCICNNV